MDAYTWLTAYMTENNFLNNVIARKEWVRRHHHVGLGRHPRRQSCREWRLDLEMPSALFMNKQILLPFIHSGEIPTAHNRRQGPSHFAQSHSVRVLRSRAN